MEKERILILSNSSSGLYEFRNELLIDFMRDYEVHVALPECDKYYEKLNDEGCHMHLTPFERRGMNPMKDMKLLSVYSKVIKEVKPSVVCTYTIKPNIYGGVVCRMSKTPYICNITGLGTAIQGGGALAKVLTVMYKFATKKANTVFFQNEYNMSFMKENKIALHTAKLLPGSGVNLDHHVYREYPTEDDGIKILSVMRIMKDKGIEEYFEVVDKLGGHYVQFILAGNYEEETRKKYEPIVQKLVAEGKLIYLGFVDNIDALYEKCHAVLHPSYHEGLSNVCLEAGACGRPVLASDIPGCRETIDDGITGLLFDAKSFDSLYKACNTFLELSHSEREKMGRKSREFVEEKFNRQTVINYYRAEMDALGI